jgi:molecular chaperone DnaK
MKCGIDLGTMFSAIAYCEGGLEDPDIEHIGLSAADGGHQLRSVVYLGPDGRAIVGQSALNMLAREPARVIQWIKRDMGEDAPRELDGRVYTPPEISAEILKQLKRDAETWVGEPIEGAIVCVPAWFGDRQREATRRAAELAGLPLIDLLAEPSAAALAVSLERPEQVANRDLLIYDLGGGTFDVVVIRTRDAGAGRLDIRTLALEGDRKLGGHDWDLALARLVAARCQEQHGVNPEESEDPRDWYFLLDQIEQRYKRDFSRGLPEATIPCDLRGHTVTVTLDEFNAATEHLLRTTSDIVDVVLEKAEAEHGVRREDLVVLLCGGSSRLPGIREMLTAKVGHEPLTLRKINPELMVVRGAAYAAQLTTEAAPRPAGEAGPPEAGEEEPARPPVEIGDVYRAVGIEVLLDPAEPGGPPRYGNEVLLPDGARPDRPETRAFEISEDNQQELDIPVLQGSDRDADRCERIGTLEVRNLPPGRPAGSRVNVTVWYDGSGILHCRAVDESGAEAEIAVRR